MNYNKFFLLVPMLALAPLAAQAQTLAGGAVVVSDVDARQSGNSMLLSLKMQLDSLQLRSNQRMVYTPVMKSGADSTLFAPIIINGRNQQIKYRRDNRDDYAANSDVVVRRMNGTEQTVSYLRSAAYEPWMQQAEVYMLEDKCGCGDVDSQESYPLIMVDHSPKIPAMHFIRPQAEARKARAEKGQAFVDFVVNKTDIRPSYRGNQAELEKITKTIDLVRNDKNVEITNIDIHGYASPEGSYQNNTRLARERAAALKSYVQSLYDLPSKVYTSNYTPEDWDGLRSRLEQSDLKNKQQLLAIANSSLTPDGKDAEMRRRYPEQYRYMLDNWYPALRHSDYTVSYTVRPFSVDEAKEILKTKPQQLSLEEMFLVAQTYEPGSQEFNDVMETAVRLYPDNPTANLNAACAAIQAGQIDKAERYLSKAGNTPEAEYAREVIEKLKINN